MIRTKAITQHEIIDRIGKVFSSISKLKETLVIYKRKYEPNSPEIDEIENLVAQFRKITERIYNKIELERPDIE